MLAENDELTIRKVLAARAGTIAELGEIRPAAQYFEKAAAFWAVVAPEKDTRNEVETSLISATWIYPVNVIDDPTSGSKHSPLMRFIYEICHFTQYGVLRGDENPVPDVFTAKTLEQHNKFIKGWYLLKAEFQRKQTIAELDATIYAERYTTPVVQFEDIDNQAVCEFIPDCIGYEFRVRESVEIKLKEC